MIRINVRNVGELVCAIKRLEPSLPLHALILNADPNKNGGVVTGIEVGKSAAGGSILVFKIDQTPRDGRK